MTTGIVFGVLLRDAEEEWPGRNQLLLALTAHVPVVLLEQRRGQRRRPSIDRLDENLFVVRNALALRTTRLGRKLPLLAYPIDGALLRRCLHSVAIDRHVYWLTVADPILALGVATGSLVYDCADPNFLPESQAEFDAGERRVATRAALTTSSARTLQEKMLGYNPKSFLLPNATSQDFHRSRLATLPRPPLLSGRSGPVVGYLGTVDWRFDASFVTAAALALPHCTFAIVGRVNANMDAAIATLRNLPNVVIPGQVGYDDGRAWVGAFTVGLVPFTMGAMNDAINPVKMYMYLMAGLPVVATAIEECRQNAFVRTADTPEEFTRLVAAATAEAPPADHEERMAFALRNTWEVRAEEAIALLEGNGLLP